MARLFAAAPLWLLTSIQGFRLPLELVMHDLAKRGIMPNEMSFTGYNFDIVSGLLALAVAAVIWRFGASHPISRISAWVFNCVGMALLFAIVTIAVLASPILRGFGDGAHVNCFVAYFPSVFLPTICVLAALTLHVAAFRHLRAYAFTK
jgi:hypothetical protein